MLKSHTQSAKRKVICFTIPRIASPGWAPAQFGSSLCITPSGSWTAFPSSAAPFLFPSATSGSSSFDSDKTNKFLDWVRGQRYQESKETLWVWSTTCWTGSWTQSAWGWSLYLARTTRSSISSASLVAILFSISWGLEMTEKIQQNIPSQISGFSKDNKVS